MNQSNRKTTLGKKIMNDEEDCEDDITVTKKHQEKRI